MNPNTRRTCLFSLLSLCITATVHGADDPALMQKKALVDARQHHADAMLSDIRTLDRHIEERIDALLSALKSVADSKDSRTKVARLKEDTTLGLSQNLGLYQRKRSEIQEQILRPTANLTDAQKKRIRQALDSRIEKRINQIIEIQKSLPTHQDYERYKVTPGYYGWDSTIVKNEDWEQNRRVTQHTDESRKKITAELKKGIARLEQQDRLLRQKIVEQPALKETLTAEIQRNDAMLKSRHEQLETVVSAQATATRAIGKGEASTLDATLKSAGVELNKEISKLFVQYNALIAFLPQLNAAQAQLAAAKAK